MTVPPELQNAVARIEGERRLDPIADQLAAATRPLATGPAGAAWRGEWLGHALHPLLTDFPLGCWLSAGLLDVFGGRSSRRAAQRLVGLGLLTVVPTAAAGAADWATITDDRPRRVGVVHALGNTVVALCYLQSWRARRASHHLRGRVWGFVGGTLAWGTGYLGGHLSLGRGVGQGLRGLDLPDTTGRRAGEETVDLAEAARILDVPPEQLDALVDENVLTPVDGDRRRFRTADVRAVRLMGG